jgi:hypothetical protein
MTLLRVFEQSLDLTGEQLGALLGRLTRIGTQRKISMMLDRLRDAEAQLESPLPINLAFSPRRWAETTQRLWPM